MALLGPKRLVSPSRGRPPSRMVSGQASRYAHPLMYPDLSGFPAEHRLLAGDAPVIAGELAAFAERAMAGHDERQRIFPDRRADGARSLGAFDLGRDVGIRDRAPQPDLPQRP